MKGLDARSLPGAARWGGAGAESPRSATQASSTGYFLGPLIFPQELAKPALEAGKVLVCKVGPGDFTSGGHFIVVTKLLEDNQVEVRDPNSRDKSLQTWDFDQIIEQTDYVWAYRYAQGY